MKQLSHYLHHHFLQIRKMRLRQSNQLAELGLKTEPRVFPQQQVKFICEMDILGNENSASGIQQALKESGFPRYSHLIFKCNRIKTKTHVMKRNAEGHRSDYRGSSSGEGVM